MLPADIDSFKSALSRRGGLALQNRFAVYMSLPLLNLNLTNIATNVLSGNTNIGQIVNDPRDIAFMCESCSLPGRIITTSEYKTVGVAKKKPYGYTNEDVSFTFLLTQDYYMKHVMDAWHDKVMNFDTHRINYKKDYVSDVQIQQLAKNNIPIYNINLKNAYPIAINAIDLSNSAENAIQKVTITMAYDDYEKRDIIDTAIDVGTGLVNSVQGLPGTIDSAVKQIGNFRLPF